MTWKGFFYCIHLRYGIVRALLNTNMFTIEMRSINYTALRIQFLSMTRIRFLYSRINIYVF